MTNVRPLRLYRFLDEQHPVRARGSIRSFTQANCHGTLIPLVCANALGEEDPTYCINEPSLTELFYVF